MSGDNEVRIGFDVSGSEARFLPVEATGREGISRLFEYEVVLASENPAVPLDAVVGSDATLSLRARSGETRVHGIVSAARRGGTIGKHTLYRVTLVPPAWRLSLGADCRIFQQQGVLAIVKKVVQEGGITFKSGVRPDAEPPERDYCVQYRESDWGFVSRLLEEEGLLYTLWSAERACEMRVSDDSRTCPPVSGAVRVPVVGPSSRVAGAEEVFELWVRQQARPRVVTLADYNQARPSLRLVAGGTGGAATVADMEVYDHPGGFGEMETGKHLARVRTEEQQAWVFEVEGRSDCPRLRAGAYFEPAGEAPPDLAGQRLLVTAVQHRATKSTDVLEGGALDGRCTYENAFVCIPRATRYRPPRVTRHPTISGVQSARVVGPANEEIYTDDQGRVKVHFPWDRLGRGDDTDSCWVRVSQLWAGQGFGAMWIPRVGQEVIVDFLEGDPDRPLVTGRVFNGQNPPPLDLPQNKTRGTILSRSTPGGGGRNELTFEDRKGGEEIFVHAERDQTEEVERNLSTWVGNDQTLEVDRDRGKRVDRDESTRIGRHRDKTVEGNESIAVEGRRRERVGKDEQVQVQGDRTHRVDGAQSVRVGRDGALRVVKSALERVGLRRRVTVGSHQVVDVGGNMTVKVGRDLARRVAQALSENVGTRKTVTVGEQLEVVCGKSRLVMHKSGRILLEGTNVKVKCDGPVGIRGKAMVLKGSAIKVLMDGIIKLKGGTVENN